MLSFAHQKRQNMSHKVHMRPPNRNIEKNLGTMNDGERTTFFLTRKVLR